MTSADRAPSKSETETTFPSRASKLLVPAVHLHFPDSVAFDLQGGKSTDCRPPKVTATVTGEWNHDASRAIKSAYERAKAAAALACDGGCTAPARCKYFHDEVELLDEEERQQQNRTEVRYKARATGRCECE